MFTAVLLIAVTWKQPECPSKDEWINEYLCNRFCSATWIVEYQNNYVECKMPDQKGFIVNDFCDG